MTAGPALIAAVETLWKIPRPGPANLFRSPAFVALSELCADSYGVDKPIFSLRTAVRSLGLPCQMPSGRAALSLDPVAAADALHDACTRNTSIRRHLCPLDLADTLPELQFGPARVGRFEAEELARLFNAERISRTFPSSPLDARRLAQFQWLVVEEEVVLDPPPEARSAPFMYMAFDRDFGEIDPHLGRFPAAVEAALFFLILAPWEDWSTMPEVDWRGFNIPWIYTADDDLFIRPPPPPSADSLTLEPWIIDDDGEEIELERPTMLRLDDAAAAGLAWSTDAAWKELVTARASPLFETPVAHFLVRAFLSSGIDEFMAHMTAIEAAVGLEMDHKRSMRPKPDPLKKASTATDRVSARLAAALNDVRGPVPSLRLGYLALP